MRKNRKITEVGHFVVIDGEKMKVGIVDKKDGGNARIVTGNGTEKTKGIFAVVQWYRRRRPLERIAYNVRSTSIRAAKEEMARYILRLQFPEFKETSELLKIVRL